MKKNIHAMIRRSSLVAVLLLIQIVSMAQTCPDETQSSNSIVVIPEQCAGNNDGQIQIDFVDAGGNYDPSLGDFTPGTGDYEYNLFDSGDGWVYSESGFSAFTMPGINVSFTAPNRITFTGLPPITDGSGYIIYLSGGSCTLPAQDYAIDNVPLEFNIVVSPAAPVAIDNGLIATKENTKCVVPFDGSIDATGAVSGGAGGYEYALDGVNFQPSPIFNTLKDDTYTLTVRDANGCIQTENITVLDNSIAPNTTISPDPAEVCINTDLILNGNPTHGGGTTFTTHSWTGDTGPLSATNIVNPTFNSATPGTFNLTYTVTDDNGCTATDNISVTVVDEVDLGLAVTEETATICENTGTNIIISSSEAGYDYQLRDDADDSVIGGIVAGTGGDISLATGNLTSNTTFNVLVSNGVCVDQELTATASVTVVPGPDVTLPVSAQDPTLCENTATNILVDNSENGFVYQLRDASNNPIGATVLGDGGQIALPTGNVGVTTEFNVTVDNGTCPAQQLNNTATVTIVTNPNLTLPVSPASAAVCPGSATDILVDNSEVGYNYQLRNDADDSVIGGIVAGTGGQISLPTGNLSSATTFNVLVSNGVCVDQELTATASVTVNTPPTLAELSGDATICAGGSTDLSVTITDGTAPYSFVLSDGTNVTGYTSGGAIAVSPATTTGYTIVGDVTDANGCIVAGSGSATVTVENSPVVSLGVSAQDGTLCESSATVIEVANSEVGVDYQLRNDGDDSVIGGIVAGTGGTISLSTGNLAATTVFNVLADNGSCPGVELTQTATVNVVNNADVSLGVNPQDGSVCQGSGTNIIISSSEAGYDYQLRDDADDSVIGGIVAGTGGDISLATGNLTSNTTFNVLVSNGVCVDQELTATASVTVVPGPDVTLPVSAQDPTLCENTATNILVDNSENGFVYQLRDASNNPIGATVLGDGGQIALPTGNVGVTTEFNVTVDNGTCPAQQLNNTATVTIVTNPNLTLPVSPASAAVCPGSATDILVDNSEVGYNYQLRNDADDSVIGGIVAGTGGQISLPTGNLSSATTFNVLVSNGVCVDQELTATASVTVNTPPTLAELSGDATICAGGSTDLSVTITDGTAPYSFVLSDGTNVTGYTSGGAIAVSPATTTGYTIVGDVTDANGCIVAGSGSATVTVENSPVVSLGVSAQDGTLCESSATVIEVANSEVGVDYQLRNDGDDSVIGGIVAGTGGTISLSTGNLAATTVFNVLADNGSCPGVELTQTATVNVVNNADVSLGVNPQDGSVCQGSGTNIIISSSEAGYDYQLRDDADDSVIGGIVAGTGGQISLPTGNLSSATTFNVLVSNGVCVDQELTATASVTVNTPPTLAELSGDATICAGGSTDLSVTITDGTAPYSFVLSDGTNVTGYTSGGAIAVSPATTTGYTIVGDVTDANGCIVAGSGSATVTVENSPVVSLGVSAQDGTLCESSATVIEVANSEVGVDYQLRNDGDDSVIGGIVAGTGGTISLSTGNLAATTVFNVLADNGSCPGVELTQTATVNVVNNADVSLGVNPQDGSVCQGSGTNIIISSSEAGYDYQLRDDADDSVIGGIVAGTGGDISLATGNLTSNTTFNVLVSNGVCVDQELTATASVTVNTPPTLAELSGDATICAGGSTDLSVTITDGTAPYSFVLSDGTNVTGYTSGDAIAVSPATTTGYTIVGDVTDANGCIVAGSGSATITIITLSANAGSDTSIPTGTNTTLNGSASNGSGAYSYSWAPAASLVNPTAQNPLTQNLTTTTDFTVTVTDDLHGCVATDVVRVEVTGGILSATAAATPTELCEGESTQLSAVPSGGTPPYSYAWDNGAFLDDASAQDPVATPSVNTIFEVTVTDDLGQVTTTQVPVTVNALPVVTTAPTDQTVCEGLDATFSVVASGSGTLSYQWQEDSGSGFGDLPGETNASLTITAVTTAQDGNQYQVIITDDKTCSVTSGVAVLQVPAPQVSNQPVDQSQCAGGDVTFSVVASGSGTLSYQWQEDSGSGFGDLPGETNASLTITAVTTAQDGNQYRVVITDQGCSITSDVTALTVHNSPTLAELLGDATICAGGSTDLSVTITDGTAPYSFVLSDGTNVTGYTSGDAIAVSPATTTGYTIVGDVTDANGCIVAGSGSATITIITLSANAGSDTSIPTGTNTTLNGSASDGSGNYSYSWTPVAQLVDPSVQNPVTQNLTSTTDFTLEVTDDLHGCVATDVVRVEVTGGILSATAAATPTELCEGESTQLSAVPSGGTPPYSYAWDNGAFLDDASAQDPVATPSVNTIFEVTVTDDLGQVTTTQVPVTVNALPVVTTAPTDQTVCEGLDATFSVVASGSGTLSYQWQEDSGSGFGDLPGETNASLTITAVTTAQDGNQYQVIITDDKTCSVTSGVAVLQVPAPQVSNQPVDQSQCAGGDVTFSVVASGSGTLSYQWQEDSGSGFGDLPGETNASLTITAVTTAQDGNQYRVVITDQGCSITSDVTALTVHNSPTLAELLGDATICAGGSTDLSVTITDGTAPYSFVLSDGTNVTGYTSGDAIAVSPATTTGYTIVGDVTDANGCIVAGSGSATITIITLSANAGSDTSIPTGTNTTLNGSASDGSGNYSYSWTPVAQLVDPSVQNPVTQNLTSTTDFTLEVTDDLHGCVATDVVRVEVTGGILSATAAATPTELCEGESTQLSAVPSGGTPPYSYAWDNGAFLDDASAQDPVATPSVNTIFEVTVTDDLGQVTTTQVPVTVNALPVVTTAPTDQTVCEGLDATFSVVASGSGTLSYQWQEDSGSGFGDLPGETNASLTITAVTTAQDGNQYQVIITDDKTCSVTSGVAVLQVPAPQVSNQPVDQSQCAGGDVTFSVVASGSGTLSYQWQEDSGSGFGDLPGETNASLTITAVTTAQDGNQYRVVITDQGCSITSDEAILTSNNAPDATFSYDATVYCATGTTSPNLLPATSGGTFSSTGGLIIDAITGEIDLTSGVAGNNYQITYLVGSGSCQDAFTLLISIVSEDPSFDYNGITSFCQTDTDPVANITGDGEGDFTYTPDDPADQLVIVFTGPNAGTIDLDASDPGVYNITYTTPGSCNASRTLPGIEIKAPVTPAFSYSSTDFCQDGSGTIVLPTNPNPALPNGTFSPITGLSIDLNNGGIDVDNSTPGDYTITYTSSNACTSPATFDVSILAAPTANAGLDGASCTFDYQLNGNTPATGAGAWSFVSGPGTAIFDDDTQPNATVTVDAAGSYTFRWEVTNSCGTEAEEVDIDFAEPMEIT